MTILKEFISNITTGVSVTDILDILVVAFLIYKILGFISNSRAEQLVKGLGLLIAAFFASQALHMYMLNWLLRSTLNIGLIALVVIFQPELRRGLEQVGHKNVFFNLFFANRSERQNTYFTDKTINEIVRATFNMAEAKTGALIVMEMEVQLKEFEETGIPIDSAITSQLMENIFEHNTPLHDGAVLVRRDRIVAATCYLPLSENTTLSKNLGTRHRAGVGVSEISDCLTIIVSEETGKVSYAREGRLTTGVNLSDLRELLHQLQAAGRQPKFVRKEIS